MTFQAPLKHRISAVCGSKTSRAVKSVTGAFAVITLAAACATNTVTDANLADNDYWQNIETSEMQEAVSDTLQNTVAMEAASLATAATPGMRTLGVSQQRKRALRALAERSIRQNNPGVYSVVKGDTLWDISERFLSRPWLWPEIWHVNPQIENPHLIYPGDRISLTYVDGKPRLQLIRASSSASGPISSFPIDSIKEFIIDPKVVSARELRNSPYVVSTEDDRLIASVGNHIYARGNLNESRYNVYRPGEALIDPDTKELLGHETTLVSKASVVSTGDPSKLIITRNNRETLVGDRLMSASQQRDINFQPRVANISKAGKIISLHDAVARAGQNQVVIINLGSSDGLQSGDILAVKGNDRTVRDVISGKKNDYIRIEGEKSGTIMVFRTFDRVSYALIVKSHRSVNLFDRVGIESL